MNKICFDRLLPRDLNRFAAMTPAMASVARLAAVSSKQWVNGSTLRVRFIGGTEAQREAVKLHASKWSIYANLKFTFEQDAAAEIRIAFNENDGAWSYMGIDCLDIPRDQPTMNLGWVDEGVILHEFGHAIACIHEHQNPSGGINWNREKVYADLGGSPNFWDRTTVDHNIFDRYASEQINGTEMDPKSIMMYSFPASWTLDGFHTEENGVLSDMDKVFIASAKMYPKADVPSEGNILPVSFITEKAAAISTSGEEDVYALNITENGKYTIQTQGSTDCVTTLYGPDSTTTLIASDDDSGEGANSMITRDLTAGKYWVSVRHYSKTAKGAYRISATRKTIT